MTLPVPTLSRRAAVLGALGAALGLTTSTALPLEAAAAPKRMVVWSKDANRAYLVENGKIKRTMKIIDNNKKTPNGDYKIWRWEKAYSYVNGRKVWLENFAPFYRRPGATANIGFHRVPTWASGKNKGKQIHPDSHLGTGRYTSGGCIRMSNKDIKAMRKFAKAGTKIRVQNRRYS